MYDVNIGETALCAKALDGLTDDYQQIKAAARATQVNTISRLTHLLISTERDGRMQQRINIQPQIDINNLNTETAKKTWNKKQLYCSHCRRTGHVLEKCFKFNPALRTQKARKQRNFNSASNNTAIPSEQELQEFTGFHVSTNWTPRQGEFLIDSGANVSMTNNKSLLNNYQRRSIPINIMCSNGETVPALGSGELLIEGNPPIVITDVLFVPGITKTLLATKSFTSQGLTIVIEDTMRIQDQEGKTIITARESNGLH